MQSCAYVASCWPCRLWRMFWAVSRQFGRFWFRFWKGFGKFKFRTRFPRRERRSRRPLYFWRSDGEYFQNINLLPQELEKDVRADFLCLHCSPVGDNTWAYVFSPTVFRDRVPGRFGGGSGGFQTGSGRVRGRLGGFGAGSRALFPAQRSRWDGSRTCGRGDRVPGRFPWWPALVLV